MDHKALVLVSYGNRGIVELEDGTHISCEYRRSVGRPLCGDRVVVECNEGQTTIVTEILAKSNEFARANAKRKKQIIAANLDQVLIVVAAEPEPSTDLVERYLVAVHSLGIEPVIVLNKCELMADPDPDPDKGHGPLSHLAEYGDLGYQVLYTSCKGPPGIDSMLTVLCDKTSILVGQSGVGKSSLVNEIVPDLDLQTGELSRVTGKGTHTTTTTIMYKLPFGGRLIDSPGVWEYGLWEMGQAELANGFIDFDPFLGQCRFNDCHHASEPDCAISRAVESGSIKKWRYESYLRLLEQDG